MVALLIGLILILFGVYAVLPIQSIGFLNWSQDVLTFLRGGAPILAFLIGLISFFIGIADIKDKIEAKKEEEAASEEDEESKAEMEK